MHRTAFGAAPVVALFGLFAAQAQAQSSIEEVVVTAQKREQSLQDVPISVSVTSGEMIDDLGMFRFEDLATIVPNLHIDESLGSPVIHIRGLGSGAENFAFEQSVGMFIDGVYSGRSRMFENPLFDVAQVEVVRGPQGALFGKNTNAGAISITTRKPTDEFEASVRGGYELEYDGYFAEGIVSGPLSDRVRTRLAARVQNEGGFVRNLFNDRDEPEEKSRMIRGTVVWDATDDIEVIAKLEDSQVRGDGGWFQVHHIGSSPLTQLWVATDPNAEDRLNLKRSSSTGLDPEYNDTDAFNATLTVNWLLGEHTLTSISAFGELEYEKNVEFTGTSIGLAQSTIPEDAQQWSQELRLLSPTAQRFEYLIGLLYMDMDMELGQRSHFRLPFESITDRRSFVDSESASIYGSGTYHLTDTFRVTASLRHARETKDGRSTHTLEGPPLAPTWLPFDLSGSRKERHTNGSVNLQWDMNDRAMAYVTYATGAKAGGFLSNDSSLLYRILQGTNDFEYEDEKAASVEVGLKTTFLDGRGNLSLAIFRTEFEDLQTSSYNGEFFIIGNAAEAESRGAEADLALLVSDNLSLNASVAYLDAEYEDYPGGQCLVGATAATGCDPVTNTQNLRGQPLVRAPEWEWSVALDWNRPISERLVLGAQVNVTYKDDFYHQPDLDPIDSEDAHHKINARLALGSSDRKWELAVTGRNLTNELTKNWSFDTPLMPGTHTSSIAPPRMVTLEATYRM